MTTSYIKTENLPIIHEKWQKFHATIMGLKLNGYVIL
jgi:hypothetical protein